MKKLCLALSVSLLALFITIRVSADCPDNLALNPGFEQEWYAGSTVGTSVSSFISKEWLPWAVLGDPTQEEVGYNFEPEYKILQRSVLNDGWYRVYAGEQAQAFFSMYSTHTAGFYQRVAVPEGSQVTFSIWVQIYTGQEDLIIDGRYPVSDLVQPMTEPTRSVKGPGDYRVYVGIDPYGEVPAGFGEALPDSIIWSDPVLDVQTRGEDAAGNPVDEWVQLEVTVTALADHVTVYTQGHPDYRTKHNDSYWDEACVQAAAPATATPRPSATPHPSATPQPTATAQPTVTPWPTPTFTPLPTATLAPSLTHFPQLTPVEEATAPVVVLIVTATPEETPTLRTPTITRVPVPTATLIPEETQGRSPTGLVLLYIVNAALIVLVVWWIRNGRRL